jgi:1-acyl-sn-glycerol-3-phosphate acyltransferase
VTVPAVVVALAVVTCAMPLLLAVAGVLDLVRSGERRAWASIRLALLLEAFLAIEVMGIALLGLVGFVTLGSRARRAALTWPVQRLYTGMHMRAAKALLGVRLETDGDALAALGGPVIVMINHASVLDVLLPGVLIANVHRIELRYVLKRELLVDPCLDIAGHWLPNLFVARDGADSRGEIEAVRALGADLGQKGGVLIYPEGTRFTREKRRRVIERLAADPVASSRAERLRHVLPVRPGGALALLDVEPPCDVLFVGHHGLEGFVSVSDIWKGALVGRTIRIKFWREQAATIPTGREARLDWLCARWQRLDDWIDSIHGTHDAPSGGDASR